MSNSISHCDKKQTVHVARAVCSFETGFGPKIKQICRFPTREPAASSSWQSLLGREVITFLHYILFLLTAKVKGSVKIYFQQPQQLLSIFTDLEDENLKLIQECREEEGNLEKIRCSVREVSGNWY